jgi:hypothetical protein
MKNFKELKKRLESYRAASAWGKGVKEYALDLLNHLEEGIKGNWFSDADISSPNLLKKELLNGAADWFEYSKTGNALIYDEDIAQRLCTPSELKQRQGGRLQSNSCETWIELQARALHQAAGLIMRSAKHI